MPSKIIEYYKQNLFLLAYKQLDIEQEIEEKIHLNKSQISYFPFSYNTIKVISIGDKRYFFRECLPHNDFKLRLDKSIRDFFDMLRDNSQLENFAQKIPLRTEFNNKEIENFEHFLEIWKKNKTFYSEIKNIGYYKKQSGFGIWEGCKKLSQKAIKKLEIPSHISYHEDLLAYFLTFIGSYIDSWVLHEFLPSGSYETFFASRTLASYRLACIMGVDRLFASCKIVRLDLENESLYGILTEKAPGIRALDCNASATPDLQRDLSILNILDGLAYETDHFANNYNVILSSTGDATGVCAFDNDSKWAFFPFPFLPIKTARGGIRLLDGEGNFNLPYIDYDFAERFIAIGENIIDEQMKFLLNKFQMWALKQRYNKIRKAMQKAGTCTKISQWTQDILQKEINSNVPTYLYQYVHKEDLNRGFNG